MIITGYASHARYYRASWQGVLRPRCIPDQGEPSCPPVEPPEQGISLPMHPGSGQYKSAYAEMFLPRQRRFHSPLETQDRWLQRPQPRGFHAPWNPDQRAIVPFGNQTGECEPRPPAGISRLQPTKAVPWNPSLQEGGWRQEVTNGSGPGSLRSA